MTGDELRTLASQKIPPGYHWEIEPYTLTDHESLWRIQSGHCPERNGWHLDIQLGEAIETLFFHRLTRPATARKAVAAAVTTLRVSQADTGHAERREAMALITLTVKRLR